MSTPEPVTMENFDDTRLYRPRDVDETRAYIDTLRANPIQPGA